MRIKLFMTLAVITIGVAMAQAQDVRRYNAYITFPKGSMTGICLLRMDDSGDGVMSVVNEFGIKAFDATYSASSGKVKMLNVVKMLDRWYIRRTVSADLVALFNPDGRLPKHRTVAVDTDGNVTITNKRMNITYQLQPIDDDVKE